MEILISQYKDPYKPTSIMESRRVFFVAHVLKMILTWQFFVPFLGWKDWKGHGLKHLDEVCFTSTKDMGNCHGITDLPDHIQTLIAGWSTSDFDFIDFARTWVLDFFLASSHVWHNALGDSDNPLEPIIATQEMSISMSCTYI